MTGPIEVLNAIETRLLTITTANGYDFNLSAQTVQFGQPSSANVGTAPSVYMSPGAWMESNDGEAATLSPTFDDVFEVTVYCFNRVESQRPRDRWEAGVRLGEAVRKAILADRSLGGLCYDTVISTHAHAGGEFGAGDRLGIAELKVTAHWQRGNT